MAGCSFSRSGLELIGKKPTLAFHAELKNTCTYLMMVSLEMDESNPLARRDNDGLFLARL